MEGILLNGGSVEDISQPIIDLVSSFAGPVIGIVGAIGVIYCILLGAKLAKAEEPQDREKAKHALKNAIVGFVLIFVLMFVLFKGVPLMTSWVNENSGSGSIGNTGFGDEGSSSSGEADGDQKKSGQ